MPDPGWYPDPLGSPHLRLWTGTAWTEQLKQWQPPDAPGSPPPANGGAEAPSMPGRPGLKDEARAHAAPGPVVPPVLPDVVAAVGALASLVGVRLPWVRVGAPPLVFSRYGTTIDGVWIMAPSAAAIVLLMVAAYRPLMARMVLRCIVAAAGSAIALIALIDVWAARAHATRITGVAVRVRTVLQPGIYVTLGAGLVIFLGGIAGAVALVGRTSPDAAPRTAAGHVD